MKNSNYIINGILLVAVIVLFILQFTGKGTGVKSPETAFLSSDSAGFHLPLAYIKTDSLFSNYIFFKDMSDELMRKMEVKNTSFNREKAKFEKALSDYSQSIQNNSFLTREKIQQEETRLSRQRDQLEEYAAQIQQEMGLEQMRINKQLQDTIKIALKQFNTPKKYEMIFSDSNNDNILYADDLYDITIEVTEFLNARYLPEKK